MIEIIDHVALGSVVPLRAYVQDLRNRASLAAWDGDAETAACLDREADDAIAAGEDPAPMF